MNILEYIENNKKLKAALIAIVYILAAVVAFLIINIILVKFTKYRPIDFIKGLLPAGTSSKLRIS